MTNRFTRILPLAVLLGANGFVAACMEDNPCHKNPTALVEDFDVDEYQTLGKDGLCYTVDPDKKNFGAACNDTALCGGGLICGGEQLPICTAIQCDLDPTKDKVCPKQGFACVATGEDFPASICIPLPPPTPSAMPSATPASDAGTGDGGGGGGDAEASPPAATPNIGTPCATAGDPVCVDGAICPGAALPYCTVTGCATPGSALEAACLAVGSCYTGAGAPADGICMTQ
jgi:hypothetical protein